MEETNFQTREFPRSGSKSEGVGKKEKKKKKKVGENNGQLRFVRHHGWRTQARLDQKSVKTIAGFASTEAAWTNLIGMSCRWP